MPFKPGQSGNPSGRPRIALEVRELARAACPKAIATLIKQLDHEDAKIAAFAAEKLLDRGVGKPVQQHEVGGADGGPLIVEIVRFSAEKEER